MKREMKVKKRGKGEIQGEMRERPRETKEREEMKREEKKGEDERSGN